MPNATVDDTPVDHPNGDDPAVDDPAPDDASQDDASLDDASLDAGGGSLFFKLVLIVNLVAGPFTRGPQRAHGVTLTEWRVLRTLAVSPGLAASEVAARLGLDKMAVSRAVRALESSGRLERRASPHDHRRAALALTRDGRALHAAIEPGGRAREDELLAGLSEAERAELRRLLDTLVARARNLPGLA